MTYFMKLNSEMAGFDKDRNTLVMGQNSSARFYLLGGAGHQVRIDGSIVTVQAGEDDDKAFHKGTPNVGKTEYVRKVTVTTKSQTGQATLVATDGNGLPSAAPITIYVADNKQGRRVADKDMDSEMRVELQKLPLRDAVIRIAEDQVHSDLIADKGGKKGADRYHLNPAYGTQWCGKFAHWCWERACEVKGVPNPFGPSGDTFLSPQKAISWGMRDDTPGQLLQYSGPDPMGKVKSSQDLREIGWNGNWLEPGDLALWRERGTGHFKHVSFVKATEGEVLVDINGNAYDAGTGSAFAIIEHPNIREKIKADYRCFFLHVKL